MPEDITTKIDSITDPANVSSTSGGTDNAAFMTEVQNRLLGQADIVSSADTNLESAFSDAIGGVRTAQRKSAQRIQSQFGRERGYLEDDAQSNFTDFSESRSGFGTQMVAFRRLVETTDKQLNDLEQRKQELILQGESNAASEIAKLQVQQLQFRQQAEQNVFSNLLGLGQFAQQQQSQNLAERQFGLQTQQFKLSGVQVAMQGTEQAFNRLGKLQEMGALSALPDDQLSELSQSAGLPMEAAKSIANLPGKQEIRAVGDTLIAVDPRTLKSTVLYNGASGGASGVSLGGGTEVSFLTSSVINGLQNLDDLTPSQREKVVSEMNTIGFANDNAPNWFRQRLQNEERQSLGGPAGDAFVEDEWKNYRDTLVSGPRFLNQTFFRSVFSQEQLEEKADESGVEVDEYVRNLDSVVQTYRSAGMTDKEILRLMQD